MSNRFSLAFLTVKEASPLEAVEIAHSTGYDMVGFRMIPAGKEPPYSLLTNRQEQIEVKAALVDTGVGVADIEIVRLGEAFDVELVIPFLEVGAFLGAKHVLVAGDDLNHARLIENYGMFLQRAEEFGLTGDLEFMPWTSVKTASDAIEIVEAVNLQNSGVLVDALHWDRSDRSTTDLRRIPESKINYIQLCDAKRIENPSVEQMIHTARAERLLPGDGEIDLSAMLDALPEGRVLSIEVPREQASKRVSAKQRATEALHAAKQFV